VFTYISKELEVDTLAIVQAAWANQKRVAVPRCIPGTRDMEFYYIRSWQDLERASFGVMEPIVQRCERVEDESRGFCLVPGFSFDVQGFRLGYGGGYYDRFLSRFGGFTVGVCYSFCVQWNLPHGYYDRSVDLLVTEKYVRRTSKKAR
ncbi:MAG: 5-formyltetrahydrofolate cyclo-ligase, partial [Faecalispora jeddahensis]